MLAVTGSSTVFNLFMFYVGHVFFFLILVWIRVKVRVRGTN